MKVFLVSAVAIGFLGACGGTDDGKKMSPPPEVPALAPGMAMVSGRVFTADQLPVAGATVSLATVTLNQGTATATTDAEGNFSLTVPGDTTVNLRGDAPGFTRGLANSVLIPAGGMVTGFELIMVPTTSMDGLNDLVGGPRVAEYGAMAVDVVSAGGGCNAAGGKVSIEPAALGKVFYGRLEDGMPDQTLTAVQPGAQPAAWIVGVLPPGFYYRLRFENQGCTMMTMPVQWRGRNYDGHVQIEAKAVSHALIFVQ